MDQLTVSVEEFLPRVLVIPIPQPAERAVPDRLKAGGINGRHTRDRFARNTRAFTRNCGKMSIRGPTLHPSPAGVISQARLSRREALRVWPFWPFCWPCPPRHSRSCYPFSVRWESAAAGAGLWVAVSPPAVWGHPASARVLAGTLAPGAALRGAARPLAWVGAPAWVRTLVPGGALRPFYQASGRASRD